jgi:diguanylate cyclase (GGDEF)-like protein
MALSSSTRRISAAKKRHREEEPERSRVMHFTLVLNAYLGSTLVLTLIFADYVNKYNTDSFQRGIFFTLLFFILVPVLLRSFYFCFEGMPGRTFHILFLVIMTLCYAIQLPSYYYIFVFIDYLAFRDSQRTRKMQFIVLFISAVNIIVLLLNLRWGFFFSVSEPGNLFVYGDRYIIQFILGYSPVLFAIFDAVSSFKTFKRQFYLIAPFLLFCGAGSTIDLVRNSSIHFYVFYSAAMLYAYFFIIRTDAGLDPLTGLGNRSTFNEFIDRLSRQNAKESYAIVMIDMDHFKRINDTLGHLEGDNALRDMAAVIKGCIRSSDFAARYGGDEFVLATRAENNIGRIMERIQESINDRNARKIRPYTIEMSYGCDVFTTGQNRSIEEFLTHIDSLMYKHKSERRRRSDRKE